jgi:sarcosine oxidase gamma subunit
VLFGRSVALRATGFPCRAGAHLNVSVAGYHVATADTDAQGAAAVLVTVEEGRVALSGTSDYLTLAPGNWLVRVEAPAQPACTAGAAAAATVTVNPPQ